MKLSIVVPTLNEEIFLPGLLRSLIFKGDEIIIADGGSTDSTRDIAKQFSLKVLATHRGRALQMNAGAAAAAGDLLWFLHADTQVPPNWREQLEKGMSNPQVIAGAFRTVIDAPGLRYRVLDLWGRFRPVLQRSFFGDQGIFVRRDVFEMLGGFPMDVLLEDVEFSRRLWRTGRVALLPGPLRTSARRWEKQGWFHTVWNHSCLVLAHPASRSSTPPFVAVVIMAKVPTPGMVKTRLIPALGRQGAAEFAKRLLQETVSTVGALEGARGMVAVAPADELDRIRLLVSPSFRLIPQTEGDLGVRIFSVFRQLFAEGYRGVMVLGADHPNLPKEYLRQAVELLRQGTDQVVLGPTEDGGYYLVGLTRPHAQLFQEIPWSSSRVLEATLSQAKRLGLPAQLLPRWFDVDCPEDLARRGKAGCC